MTAKPADVAKVKDAMALLKDMGYQNSSIYDELVDMLPLSEQPYREYDYTATIMVNAPVGMDISRATLGKAAKAIVAQWKPITVKQGKSEITFRPDIKDGTDLYW